MNPSDYGRDPEPPTLTIRDPEGARLLSEARSRRFFEPFLARDCTVSEAATAVGCSIDTMMYRVRLFQRAGLLKTVRREPRRGRAIIVYRSTADRYFVPFDATPFADLEARIRQQQREREDLIAPVMAWVLRESGREGRLLYRNAQGEVWDSASVNGTTPSFDFARDEHMDAYVHQLAENRRVADIGSGELLLSDTQAKALLFELYQLLRLYRSTPDGSAKGKRYLYQFAVVPRDEG